MTPCPAYAKLVADFGRRFTGAANERERADALADFNAECILLRALGPRDPVEARDPAAERILAAYFAGRAH